LTGNLEIRTCNAIDEGIGVERTTEVLDVGMWVQACISPTSTVL
jgi:hypothetical protein